MQQTALAPSQRSININTAQATGRRCRNAQLSYSSPGQNWAWLHLYSTLGVLRFCLRNFRRTELKELTSDISHMQIRCPPQVKKKLADYFFCIKKSPELETLSTLFLLVNILMFFCGQKDFPDSLTVQDHDCPTRTHSLDGWTM